jgi:broad specificity phosphatase PhoE
MRVGFLGSTSLLSSSAVTSSSSSSSFSGIGFSNSRAFGCSTNLSFFRRLGVPCSELQIRRFGKGATMNGHIAAASASFPEASLYPLHRCKVIHVVRHGQGFHNVAGELDYDKYMSWEFEDADLTPLGWQQAEALHQHLEKTHIRERVELVVVSPLTRTLQTAAGVFGTPGSLQNGQEATDSPLMVSGVGNPRHEAISSVGAPLFIANEWCREMYGSHPCDKRREISYYKTRFPAIDFSEVETEKDTWWNADIRETADHVQSRAKVFIKWLLDRKESQIAVVSHSTFIFNMLQLFGEDCSDVVKNELHQYFRNCEMRSFIISDRMSASTKPKTASTDFAGGIFF